MRSDGGRKGARGQVVEGREGGGHARKVGEAARGGGEGTGEWPSFGNFAFRSLTDAEGDTEPIRLHSLLHR